MNRTTIGLLVGLSVALVGILVTLQASSLATHWELIGPDAWGGTTDPGSAHAYRMIGIVVAAFGFVILALSFHRWQRDSHSLVRR
jgi:hypothetical protein